jgi:hypothetical protein
LPSGEQCPQSEMAFVIVVLESRKYGHKLNRDVLFEAFEAWCIEQQVACPDKNVFFRDLYLAYPKVKGRERYVSGILVLAA